MDSLRKYHLYHKIKDEALGSSATLLDLGCGKNSPVKGFAKSLSYSLAVDSYAPYLEESRAKKIHSAYIRGDILTECRKMPNNSFDCVMALDVIEHFEKIDGFKLLAEMERLARKKIIIYTPNGFLKQTAFGGNGVQRHLSGWTAEEMRRLGFKVYGMSGLKFFRKEFGEIRFRPVFFWRIVASVTQIFAYYFPGLSFQILCVKTKRVML